MEKLTMTKKQEYSKRYYEKVKNNPDFKEKRLKWRRSWAIKNREHARKLNRKWARNNPIKVKDAALRLKYNITIEYYNEMLAKQNNKCAICGVDANKCTRKLSVDHCHKSNKIRGLLCMLCNRAIGNLKDDINLLDKAKEYLLKYL